MAPAKAKKRGRGNAAKKEKPGMNGDIKEEVIEQEGKALLNQSDDQEGEEKGVEINYHKKKPVKRGHVKEETNESDEPQDTEPKKEKAKKKATKPKGRGRKVAKESSTEPSEDEKQEVGEVEEEVKGDDEPQQEEPKGKRTKRETTKPKGRGRKVAKESSTEPSEDENPEVGEVEEEVKGDDEPQEEEPKGKRTKRESNKPKGRGRKVAKESSTESSEDEKMEAKKEVKKEVKTPTKRAKKGEDAPVPRPIKYESLGVGPPRVPSTGRKYVGSHVSAAGGIWNAFENAEECSSKSFALFLRNQRQWNAKALDEETVEKWKEAGKDFAPHLILPHGSYLMNLGSPVPETLEKSRGMLVDELQRCQRLGIPHYNFHPGSTTGKISREECCRLIAESINIAHSKTDGVICVLENMSRQGFTIGGDLHELRLIIEHVKDKTRVGVCLDTCHSHAAGYDLSTMEGFEELLQDFEKIIGWQFLRGLHINDSKGKVGDHLDRHENIGKGTIGLEGFRRVMNCDRFNDLPLILETPWTSNAGYASEVKKLESIIKK